MTLPHWLAAFVLLACAHSAPWAAAGALGRRWAAPVDGGVTLADGRRLFGAHKTWRGVLAAVLCCAAVAPLLGYSVSLGFGFAALAMGADLATSVLKRRLNLAPGREVPGVDQIPEALVPLVLLAHPLGITVALAGLLTAVFLLLDLAALPLRHRPHRLGRRGR